MIAPGNISNTSIILPPTKQDLRENETLQGLPFSLGPTHSHARSSRIGRLQDTELPRLDGSNILIIKAFSTQAQDAAAAVP